MLLERLPEFFANHPVLVLAFAGVAIALLANEATRFTRGYRSLSPAGLTQLINRESPLLVDVSPHAEYEKGHIIGARQVAMSQFDPESKQLSKVKDLPVAVYCRNGTVSTQAAKRLVKAGFKQVYWLEGGLAAWQQADMPLARGKS